MCVYNCWSIHWWQTSSTRTFENFEVKILLKGRGQLHPFIHHLCQKIQISCWRGWKENLGILSSLWSIPCCWWQRFYKNWWFYFHLTRYMNNCLNRCDISFNRCRLKNTSTQNIILGVGVHMTVRSQWLCKLSAKTPPHIWNQGGSIW